MDLPVWLPEEMAREFIRTRYQSAGYYRAGGSSPLVRLIGAGAALLERAAASVRRWARGASEPGARPHRASFVRH
ncbi:MAG: hypothetical protein HUU14_02565 [Dehalococcoidia bacterium]|nr:MAG: hypothetical protein EDM76_02575 [bacterium]MCK6564488.1 hypothetical protein [Dehalococcoidia bacterium]MCL4232269.1 hypothetical protein [Dehalococcoidia bacterium]NUQ54748.1 hypothetical protein [Dehalococcoidia bacterium]RIL01604.1 MAG: hypothetical protein DCC78_10190 [bacterium]